MTETLIDVGGVGLAACQIGKPLALFVFENGTKHEAVRNPSVRYSPEGTNIEEEGCLSIPGFYAPVRRYNKLSIWGTTPNGDLYPEQILSGYTARIVQHEMDHLDGMLFVDRLDGAWKRRFRQWTTKNAKQLSLKS